VEQPRRVETPRGTITYYLLKKRVKNLNLRIRRDKTVILSAPIRCPAQRADQLILEKCDWVADTLERLEQDSETPMLPEPDREVCVALLSQAVARVYPLIAPLGVEMPKLKLRRMKSQWGNCHWTQGYITLNVALARCPEELRDYVALHELAHFLHHDHGAGFYAVMDRLMPDWRQRRKRLQSCAGALER
jgi:hypothetical protein